LNYILPEEINKKDNLWDVLFFISHHWAKHICNHSDLEWKGISLEEEFNKCQFELYVIKGDTGSERLYFESSLKGYEIFKNFYSHYPHLRKYRNQKSPALFYDDLEDSTVRKRLKEYMVTSNYDKAIILKKSGNNNLFKFKPISNLDFKKSHTSKSKAKSSNSIDIPEGCIKAYRYIGNHFSNSVNAYKYSEITYINPEEGGLYLPVKRGICHQPHITIFGDLGDCVYDGKENIKRLLSYLGKNLYLIKDSDVSKLSEKWQLFDEYVNDYFRPIEPVLQECRAAYMTLCRGLYGRIDELFMYQIGHTPEDTGTLLFTLAKGFRKIILSDIPTIYTNNLYKNKILPLIKEYEAKYGQPSIVRYDKPGSIYKDILDDWYTKHSSLLPNVPRRDWDFDRLIEYYYGVKNISRYIS
jgi:hypothetical protein